MLSKWDVMLVIGLTMVISQAPGGKTATVPTPEMDSTPEMNPNNTVAANSFGNEPSGNSTGLITIQETISLPPWKVNASSPPAMTNATTVSDEPTQAGAAATVSAATDSGVTPTQTGARTQDTLSSTTPHPTTTRKAPTAAVGPREPPDQTGRFEYDYKTLRYQGLSIAFILFVVGIMVLFLDRCRAPRCSGCHRRSKSGKYTVANNM